MTVEFWYGQPFEYPHERQAAEQIRHSLEEKFGSQYELLIICANFYISGKRIDIAILKKDAIIVVELKEINQQFRATENGEWRTIPDNHIISTNGENPFEQVSTYRRLWMDYLHDKATRFLPEAKIHSLNFTHVSAMVVISPIIPQNTINDITSPKVKPWFQLVGLDKFANAVNIQTSKQLYFSDNELRALIKVMNLRAADNTIARGIQLGQFPFYGRVPPIPSIFIGREKDLQELKLRLGILGKNGKQKNTNIQVLTAIRGWPGVGKTTMAAALVHDPDIKKAFPDGVIWASLGQKAKIFSELLKWCQDLGYTELGKYKTPDELHDLLVKYFEGKRMLLIVDDVWNVSDAELFRVGGRDCGSVFTTRLSYLPEKLTSSSDNIYRLKELDIKYSLDLLKQIAPEISQLYPNECKELVSGLEGLPLAIQVAARLLNAEMRRGKNVPEFMDKLRNDTKLLEAEAPSDRTDLVIQTTPTIAALLMQSIDILDIETKERFAFLGGFAPKPAMFDLEDIKAQWGDTDPLPTVEKLLDLGLLEYIDGMFQMHSLLVMLAQSLLS